MSKAKQMLFEELASELALLSDADRGEFAEFLVKNYAYTASELHRDIGYAEMDAQFAPYKTFDSYTQDRDNILL